MDLHKSTEMSNASASSPYVPDGNRLVERWYDWVRALPNEVILDGGLGSELESRGYDLSTELWTGSVLVTDPTKVSMINELKFHTLQWLLVQLRFMKEKSKT